MRFPELRLFSHPRGFTLIELMVSMTVLTLIILFISQLVSSATTVTVGNRQRLDADAQARIVFDRMAFDFGKMLKRPDLDNIFAKINGTADASGANTVPGDNDKMFFFSESPAFFDGSLDKSAARSPVALIGYRINPGFQLERLGKMLTWDKADPAATPGGIVFLTPLVSANPLKIINPDPATTLVSNWGNTVGSAHDSPPYTPAVEDADYHVLAEQVCRLEICFQLKNGNFSPLPLAPVTSPVVLTNKLNATDGPTVKDDASQSYSVGSRWYDTLNSRAYVCVNNTPSGAIWNLLGMQDVRAIVVAIAILDATSSRTLPTVQKTLHGQKVYVPDLSKLIPLFTDANMRDVLTPGNASTNLTDPNFPQATPPATPAPARLMAEAWGNRMKQTDSSGQPDFAAKSGLSKLAAVQVRIYQRSFLLNTP